MTPQVWATIVFGLASTVLAVVALVRAGRAAALAERAERRAVDAESRAEEAHGILRDRFTDDREKAQAKLEAPTIADRWRAQIRIAAQQVPPPTLRQLRRGQVVLPLNTLADRYAVQIIRGEREALGVTEIIEDKTEARVTVMSVHELNRKRAQGGR
jgi:hypothetical protein